MNYIYIENLLLDNIEKHNTLLNIFQSIIEPLNNNENSDIENIVNSISNNNIEKLNKKIKNQLDILSKDIEHKNISDLFKFIDIYTDIYKCKIQIDNTFNDIYKLINIDYKEYNFNFTTDNLIKKIKSNIQKEYEFYNNNKIIKDLNKYFEINILKFLKEKVIYTYISDIFKKSFEIIDLYINLFNNGIKYTKDNNTDLYLYLLQLNEQNKDIVLNILYKGTINIKRDNFNIKNSLQNFNLVSKFLYDKNKKVLTLNEIIYNLTKIKSKKLELKNSSVDIKNISKELNVIIKNYSNSIKKPVSILIIHINNNINYIIDLLLQNKIPIDRTQGINNDIIKIFNTIQVIDNKNKLNYNNIHLINYNKDFEFSFILQTNDFNNFKVLYKDNSHLINKNIVEKILRNEPSKRIITYNQFLEDNILSYKTTEYQEQHALDTYLDFNTLSDESEKIYKNLSKLIYDNIMKKIKKSKITDNELYNIINNTKKIADIFSISLNNFYNIIIKNIKNLSKEISNNIYLSYISLCDDLVYKFTKEISNKYNFYKSDLDIDNSKKLELIISDSINITIDKSDLYNYIIDKYNILNSYKDN